MQKKFVCEKYWIEDEDDQYCKLIVFECDADGTLSVLDITHHNSETLADDWLKAQWKILSPPKIGERLEFEANGY